MSSIAPGSEPSRLRLWPAVVLLVVLWGLTRLPSLFAEPPLAVFMAAFFGPMVCALSVVVWWMAGSRATWSEKLVGLGGLVLIFVLTLVLVHPTMRGFPIFSMLLPWGVTAFVVGLVASRWLGTLPRTLVALLAAAIAFGFWTLVRLDGVWGDFQAERAWRWQPTAEERFLAGRSPAAHGAATNAEVAEADWPGFRGPDRDAVVPGLALAEDWSARPPRELWRISVGPGWSSFAVAGQRLFTQEQRGEYEVVVAYVADTGAEVWATPEDARVLEDGGFSDAHFGGRESFKPVAVDRIIRQDDIITLGDLRITVHEHPGHTEGSSSYTFQVNEAGRDYNVGIVNMGTINGGKHLVVEPTYDNVAVDFATTYNRQKKLDVDVWVAAHNSQYNMHDKYQPGQAYDPETFVDPAGYIRAIERLETAYLELIADELDQ